MADHIADTPSKVEMVFCVRYAQFHASQDIPVIVKHVRDTFNTGRTKPLAWRKAQIQAIGRLVVENAKALETAYVAVS